MSSPRQLAPAPAGDGLNLGGMSLRELATRLGGELVGDGALLIRGVSNLAEAQEGQVAFFANLRYQRDFENTRASAVLVGPEVSGRPGQSLVRVKSPNLAFARASQLFHPLPRMAPGVSARAQVHPEAEVHPEATVLANVVVEAGARIGARTILYPGVYVGASASVGEDCLLYPNVVVMDGCQVGRRCILHPGVVIGADGFGFAFDPEKLEHVKVPQVGIARIEDDVEIGANSCVDRATSGETVVKQGAKLDNLVQVGHNVQVGRLVLLCAQVGIAGSSEIGDGAVLAGQVGVADHVKVASRVTATAQTGIPGHVEDPGTVVSGTPAIPNSLWRRMAVSWEKLPELLKQVRSLQKRVDALETGRKS